MKPYTCYLLCQMYGRTVEIKGLRARGGFEIISLKWKNGQIESAVIKSTLGGNLHLRVHQELAMDGKKFICY